VEGEPLAIDLPRSSMEGLPHDGVVVVVQSGGGYVVGAAMLSHPAFAPCSGERATRRSARVMAMFFDWTGSMSNWRRRAEACGRGSRVGPWRNRIAELWKDQRELSSRDVRLLAALVGATREEVASALVRRRFRATTM
jgi:hypothetical protein